MDISKHTCTHTHYRGKKILLFTFRRQPGQSMEVSVCVCVLLSWAGRTKKHHRSTHFSCCCFEHAPTYIHTCITAQQVCTHMLHKSNHIIFTQTDLCDLFPKVFETLIWTKTEKTTGLEDKSVSFLELRTRVCKCSICVSVYVSKTEREGNCSIICLWHP